ncbi:LamB/YcsF family protein [Falsibacillus pallidus]|uniref:LamB/YcsF family protein n=1 Tax=Falsibacillus pallidus TaxID=493781 RepID=UPI003D976611
MFSIDLNCDLGESFGSYSAGNDAEIMKYITSANIACGFHAGDAMVMKKTVQLAKEASVKIGAHPGFPDLQGFGRRQMGLSSEEIYSITLYQLGALEGFLRSHSLKLNHIKPHGALYNMAADHAPSANAIAKAVNDFDRSLIFYGLSGSELTRAAEAYGLSVGYEVFADRTYMPDGKLTPRTHEKALISNLDQAVAQSLQIITEQKVTSVDGTIIPMKGTTICLHSDGPGALELAKRLNEELKSAGITVKSLEKEASL